MRGRSRVPDVSMFLFTSLPSAQTTGQPPHAAALRAASAETGVSFDYLVATAQRESGFKASAKASTSSARGLFQFIEQTWLRTMREEGGKIGLADEAAAIRVNASGKAVVDDPATRTAILKLRDDPEISARMAAALTQKNAAALEASLGRAPSAGELYIAHFLGAAAAGKLIRLAGQAPQAAAASAFPAAANANRSIFYDRAGAAKSASAVYAGLIKGFGAEAATQVATAAAEPASPVGNAFHALFQTARSAPVSPSLAAFWRPAQKPGMPLDLTAFAQVRS